MKKIRIVISTIILVLIVGIGGKIYMDKKENQEIIIKNVVQSKKEVVEMIHWNYENVHQITFEYPTPDNGAFLIDWDKSLTTTPLGGLTLNGYMNDDRDLSFSIQLIPPYRDRPAQEIGVLASTYLGGDADDKLLKIRNSQLYKKHPADRWVLNMKDIDVFKKQGFDSNITAQQILEYLKVQGYNENMTDAQITEQYGKEIKDNGNRN